MLRRLGEQHPTWQRISWEATAAGLCLPPVWQRAQPDATWRAGEQIIVAECYARVGRLKAGHRRKLAMDALKLLALRQATADSGRLRCLLVFPEELAEALAGEGWFAEALRLSAELTPVALAEDERQRLLHAAKRQAQGQARTRRAGQESPQ